MFSMTGGSGGNADLYVLSSPVLSPGTTLCHPGKPKSTESCVIKKPAASVYYVLVRSVVEYKNLSLRGLYNAH
jgi:hypothetical protein